MLAKFGTNSGGNSGGQILNQYKWNYIQLAKFGTNASAFFLAGEITKVTESIPWVRCASGNV